MVHSTAFGRGEEQALQRDGRRRAPGRESQSLRSLRKRGHPSCSRSSKEPGWLEQTREAEGREGGGVTDPHSIHRALWAMGMTLGFTLGEMGNHQRVLLTKVHSP